MLHHPSIRKKLTRIILATCGASILLACTVLAVYDVIAFRRDLANNLLQTAETTGSNTTAALAFGDTQSAREILSSLKAQPQVVEACIYARDGSVFAMYARPGSAFTPPLSRPAGMVATWRYIILFQPIWLNGEQVGTIYLKSDLENLYQRTARFGEAVLIVILASFVTAYLLASRLQKRISGPILELARTAFAVSVKKDYSIRAVKRSTDEIGFLFDCFNEMLNQIQERETALQSAHDDLEVRVSERTRELQTEVAERKEAEQALEAQKSFLKALIDNCPLGIAALGPDNTVQICNPAFESLFLYRQQDILGRSIIDVLAPDELRAEMESTGNKMVEGTPVHRVTRRKRSDGSLMDVETFSAPIFAGQHRLGALAMYQDITERKRAEQELAERTSFLNSLIENIPLGIVTTALDDAVQMCNPAFEKLFGYRQQDILGRNIIDTLSTGELRTEMQSTRTRMLQRKPVHMATRRKRKDGVLLDVEVLAAPILQGEEQSGNLVIYQDITERKRAQQELEEQKTFLNSLIDNCPVAIVALSVDGAVKMCNPAFESLFGYRQQDIAGRLIVDVLSPAESRPEMESVGNSLRQGTPIHLTTQRRRSDGSLVDVEVFGALIATEEKSLGCLVMYQDITERKRAQQELEERTSFLNSLIENTPVGIAAIDADGAVRMCNPAFESLFGYRQQDILGRQMLELLTTPDRHAEVKSNTKRLEQGKTTHVVTRRKRSDGSLVDVEAYSVPLSAAGRYTGAVLLYQDITERKRAEEALLRAKEAAEAASRAKSEFLANMSHEIRTPMNGIIGMTELALDTDLAPEQREYLGMVKTSADSLLTLINDILDFSKIEAGKLDVEMIDFPFTQSLGETVKTLAFRAHQKGLELAWRVQPGVPDRLKGDIGRLRQVLVNLIGNAVKFTEQGEIVVEVEKEAEDDTGILLHFRVRDTGIGIPKEKQKMVFDAFTQVDSSATRRYGGTGLGLAITSRLVKLMGGTIWLESEPGRGSTFHFTSRFEFADNDGPAITSADPEEIQGLPVLVVDDNETNRLILVEMLSAWGMRPSTAKGGRAALAELTRAHAAGQPFCLLITDMQMPEMDGLTLSGEVRKNPAFGAIPILLLSSTGHPDEGVRVRQLTIAACLIKPVQPSELLDAILSAVSKPVGIQESSPAKPNVSGEGMRAMKVLLAEDNAVNRKLATALLEKWGHAVVVAENGREVLEALERESVDLVLMDVQMPEMDGFHAIRAIRTKEKTTGAHLPIIALTAHAMQGDRERCLEVGADDYVSKPIRTSELLAAMDRLRNPQAGPRPAARPAADSPVSRALDLAAALERVEGDRELLEELVRIFAGECPNNLAEIRRALDAADAPLLERLAHTMKGAAANLGAKRLSAAAFELEKQARSGGLKNAAELIDNLKREIDRLMPEIDSLCRKVSP
jgi:PAS domain S-box-containing protein